MALVIGGLATDAADAAGGAYATDINDVVGFAAACTLWWRRRAPVLVAGLTFAAAMFAPLAAGAAVVSVFTVAIYRPTAVAVAVTAVRVGLGMIAAVRLADEPARMQNTLVGVLFTVAALGWGLVARARQERLAALAERAERAENEQQARVAEARRAERTRIAAEMHDVLAHRLSMLSLHAGAIELRPNAAPENLTRAAGVIRSSAHLALEELRTVIGVLRDDVDADVAPQPTASDIGALVEECRAAGMRVDVADILVDPTTVPPESGRHLYRVVQEGLTNARKHAPPDSPVRLSVCGKPGEGLRVEITNPDHGDTEPVIPGAGVGLVGLRERVELVGGTLDCGADDAGIHRLQAWLPWPR